MGGLLTLLVPTALAGAFAPVLILPVIFLLGTRNPLRNASIFAIAALATYAILGAAALLIVGEQAIALGDDFSRISAIVGLALGGIMLLMVPLQLRSASQKGESLNRRLQGLDFNGARRVLGLGMVMPIFGAKNLLVFVACLSIIAKEQVGTVNSLLAMLGVLLIFSIQMLIPIAIYAAVSERAARALAAIQNWVAQNNRVIGIGVSLVVGLYLLSKGLVDLAIFK